MKKVDVCNVKVNIVGSGSDLRKTFFELLNKGKSKIYTVNPEFIVDSYFDNSFRNVLNNSDFNTIDGFGVALFVKNLLNSQQNLGFFKLFRDYYRGEVRSLVLTGVDLTEKLLQISNNEGLSVFLLGGSPDKNISFKAYKILRDRFPKIKFVGYSSDFSHKTTDDKETIKFIHKKMKESSCKKIDLLLVAYGHKNQEFWIERNAHKIPANVAIGVGGTLDYISGEVTRAPIFLRELGLEWLYRFISQPQRFVRILKATILFTIVVILNNKKSDKKRY